MSTIDRVTKAYLEKKARGHPAFTHVLEPANSRFWEWDDDILEARTLSGDKIQKFSWNPRTGEFLLIHPGQLHASVKGKAPFDDYVRGIILRPQHTVAFRPFYPTWVQAHPEYWDDDDLRTISYDAQQAAARALQVNGSKGWTFRYDISNADLLEMTGNHRW